MMLSTRFTILSAFLFLAGCVSVSLPSSKASKAQGVKAEAPSKPFERLKDDVVDEAWISKTTGNTISYLSDCNPSADRSLESLQGESLNVLSKLEILEEKSMPYNGRRALWVTARGEVDGVPVRMSLVTLKKNECNYSLTYTGLESGFESETSSFQNFVRTFEAP